jgi:excinuclease UvrABC nuclease subunit
MTTQAYQLIFDGYWLAANVGGLPDQSGIYGVYAGVYDQQANTVALNRLLYLGEAVAVRSRVINHDRLPDWKRLLKPGEVLCFNVALISPDGARRRAEAAMIFKHKPPCNIEYVDSFPFDTTSIATGGKNSLMQSSFTVVRTDPVTAGALGRRW